MKKYLSGKILFGLLVCLLVIGISVKVNYQLGFYSVVESEMYIPFFLGDSPFLYKLFYYPITDLYYRARELSNLFNFLDTQFLVISARLGFPHLLSGTYFTVLTLIVMIEFYLSRKHFGAYSLWITLLVSLAYLTSPAIFLSGMYFRPSKIITALGIVLSVTLLFTAERNHYPSRLKTLGLLAAALLVTTFMGLTDEQGIFYAVIFGSCGILFAWINRRRQFLWPAAGFFLGTIFLFIYRSFIGPRITNLVTGLSPQIWGVDDLNLFDLPNLARSFTLMITYLQLFIGTLPLPFVTLTLLSFTGLLFVSLRQSTKLIIKPALAAILLLTAGFTVFTLFFHIMSLRHPVLFWPEYSVIYYPIPFYTVLYAVTHLLLLGIFKTLPRIRPVIFTVLLLWVTANSLAIPRHMAMLTSPATTTSVYFGYTPPLLNAVRHRDIPLENFNLEHWWAVAAIRRKLSP